MHYPGPRYANASSRSAACQPAGGPDRGCEGNRATCGTQMPTKYAGIGDGFEHDRCADCFRHLEQVDA
ncbi:putative phosphatidylserine synthase [Anopheles sinensis]|uniref:Putative phosphatidylserine synthase n=1 Tax=Anopheles sinensis TaxID=74873 RepID=A0A084VCJ6_ANOSI|nr:putative phosphatidylserine synthase [Anopheles sinensis]